MELDFFELLKVIFLGIVEGITEWLPISSTGHMYLVDEFLPLAMDEAFKEVFFVVIQLGAILAVIVMFWKKLWPFGIQAGKPCAKADIFGMWLKVIVACVPTAILGLLFDDLLEEYCYNAPVIASMLILYGVAFIIIERWNKTRTPKANTVAEMSYLTAFFIGIFQALAMIPGTSRSGATIVGALLLGVGRTAAAEFTFFLAIPTMFGASLLKIVKYFLQGLSFSATEVGVLILGMAVAFVVSVFVIKFLMGYIKKHDFQAFGWYRIALGAVVLVLLATPLL